MRQMILTSAAAICALAGGALAQTAPAGRAPADAYPPGQVPPTAAYQGGAGSPSSTAASNITGRGHGQIAPRLPNPNASNNTPEALLASAQRALNSGRTGAAQQALEMAETRALTRTADPAMAGQPDQAAMVQHISAARRALGERNVAAAKAEVAAAIGSPMPPPGPATTTTY